MKKKILVVDDDFQQRELYQDFFQNKGYEVVIAHDGLEGLEKALKEKPDAIFTGIIMPRMDGFELIRNLRNAVVTANVPIVMFSHLGREEDRKKAKSLNNVEFMVKGYDSPEFIAAKIGEMLRHAEVKNLHHNSSASVDEYRNPRTHI